VVTCPQAGCAGELVVDGETGFVVPLDPECWATRLEALLGDPALLARVSERARVRVGGYTFERAAAAFASAC
jgi:glycosyltransferase involved in cell wall biosynthesis